MYYSLLICCDKACRNQLSPRANPRDGPPSTVGRKSTARLRKLSGVQVFFSKICMRPRRPRCQRTRVGIVNKGSTCSRRKKSRSLVWVVTRVEGAAGWEAMKYSGNFFRGHAWARANNRLQMRGRVLRSARPAAVRSHFAVSSFSPRLRLPRGFPQFQDEGAAM